MSFARKLLSRSAIIFAARLCGAAIMFGCQALIARQLGRETLGQYLEAFAVINLISAVLPLGFHTIASYFAAEYTTKAQGGLLRRFLAQSYAQTFLTTIVVFIAGLLGFTFLWQQDFNIRANWMPIVIMALALAVSYISGAVLVAMRRPILGMMGDSLLRPLIVACAVVYVLLHATNNALAALLWFVALAYCFVATAYFGLTHRIVRTVDEDVLDKKQEARRWWTFALPWTVIAVANDFFFDIDLLLLSNFMDYGELAIFGAITKLFALAAFALAAISAVILPDIFEAHSKQDKAAMIAQFTRTNLATTAASVFILIGVLLVGPLVLEIFGEAFVAGSGPLAVLCLGLCVRSFFGPSALLLSFENRPNLSLPAVGIGLCVLLLANAILVPMWGLYGAACAAVTAMSVWSVLMWFTALRATQIDVSLLSPLRDYIRKAPAAST